MSVAAVELIFASVPKLFNNPGITVLEQTVTIDGYINKEQINNVEEIEASIADYLGVDQSDVKISNITDVPSGMEIQYNVMGQASTSENNAVETKMNDILSTI